MRTGFELWRAERVHYPTGHQAFLGVEIAGAPDVTDPEVTMPRFLELSVSLDDVLPRPLRRFHIRATATFAELHAAIMAATGWRGGHLWAFVMERFGEQVAVAGPAGPGGELLELYGMPVPDAATMRLSRQLGPEGATACRYQYDFGDGWEAIVLVHDVVELRDKGRRRLVSAEHAWPPDDCGGPPGFAALQEALATGEDPEGLVEWARETWGWTGAVDEEGIRVAFDR